MAEDLSPPASPVLVTPQAEITALSNQGMRLLDTQKLGDAEVLLRHAKLAGLAEELREKGAI